MKTINDNAYRFMQALGESHRILEQHALNLIQDSGVSGVKHVTNIPDLPNGFHVEEFVDAELVSGEAISWYLGITITEERLEVEADVRRIHSEGQDVIKQVCTASYATDAECAQQLPGIARCLCLVDKAA